MSVENMVKVVFVVVIVGVIAELVLIFSAAPHVFDLIDRIAK